MTKLTKNQKNQLWSLILAADFDFKRVVIAEHELDRESLTLWLEDKEDFKDSLDECVHISIPVAAFAKCIEAYELNSHTGIAYTFNRKSYRTKVEIDKPIAWYENDATAYEQNYAREMMLKQILEELKAGEVAA